MARPFQYLLVLIGFLAACSPRNEGTAEPVEPSGTLIFIHLNDTYRIDAVEEWQAGGFGRVVTIIRQLQQQGNDVRILHAGDFLFLSLESRLWQGEQMVDAFNFMDDIAPISSCREITNLIGEVPTPLLTQSVSPVSTGWATTCPCLPVTRTSIRVCKPDLYSKRAAKRSASSH